MKIDQALIFYLLKHKELPLQGIGVFKLEGAISEPADINKPVVIPSDAISFVYNPRIGEDPELVKFISETTGKITPLASADLDSYLTLGRQFINIGKPMILPNIGTLEKTNTGELVFKGGEYVMDQAAPKKVSMEVEEVEPKETASFSDFPPARKNKAKGALFFFILIILGLIIWAVWNYVINAPQDEETFTHTEITPVNDSDQTVPLQDSVPANVTDSSTTAPLSMKPETSDTVGFQIVVGIYKTQSAGEARLRDMKLSGRNVILYTTDSVNYKVAEPFPNLPLRDSTRIKDSMRGYYGDRNYLIEKIR